MKKVTVLKTANLIGFLGTIAVNALANTLPINGWTTGALSDRYPNLFVPAGLTFSVWGAIYLLLGAFIVYQLAAGRNADRAVERVGGWFVLSSLLNVGWIFAWHYLQVALSLAIMIALLLTLIAIYLRLRIGKEAAETAERFFVRLPFSVYLGWISIATIANASAVLVNAGWRGGPFSEQFWTVAVVLIGAALTIAVVLTRTDIGYGMVVIWAYVGIILKRSSAPPADDGPVTWAAAVGIGLIVAAMIIAELRKGMRERPA
jgi:hypothetical protein